MFDPVLPVGRDREIQHVATLLKADGDFLLAGVPGIGRRTVLAAAARQVGARVVEIDCIRAIGPDRLLEILARAIATAFADPAEQAFVTRWGKDAGFIVDPQGELGAGYRILRAGRMPWEDFEALLALPQAIAEWLQGRVAISLANFPHLRSWDRRGEWESYLRQEVQRQSRVSYVLVATVAEAWVRHSNLQVLTLGPLGRGDLERWLVGQAQAVGGVVEAEAIETFGRVVDGHISAATSLWRRVQGAMVSNPLPAARVSEAAIALVEDFAPTFESLLLLLPDSQVRLLESLALDPTDSPHARDYVQRHGLSRGGSLQGALASLQQKGLVYGPELGYRVTLPLLGFWLRQRLG